MTVEAAFNFPPGGATLAPSLPLDTLPQPFPATAILIRPDGSETETRIRFGQTHINRPYSERTIENAWMLTIWLPGFDQADIPPGAELWLELPAEG